MSLAATLAATSMLLQLAVSALKSPGLPDMARDAILSSLGKHVKSINAASDAAAVLAHVRETSLSDVVDWAQGMVDADTHGATVSPLEIEVARAILTTAGGTHGKAH
jgi:hypothetical protein